MKILLPLYTQNLKYPNQNFISYLLVLMWLVIGFGLRLSNLSGKSPWTDEFSTLVFSLGNSFLKVPLNEVITIDTLLQPLQPNPEAGVGDVLTHLFNESNHPPLYFTLTHLWLRLFPTNQGLVSVWGARLLAAIFGGLSIPAIFGLSWLTFRSRLISHFTAAMMAVSPFGIFLAQEARHYTLAILWVIASLACLIITLGHIQNRTKLPVVIVLFWIIINALGIATHYFFALTLCAEVFVLIFMIWREWKQNQAIVKPKEEGRRKAEVGWNWDGNLNLDGGEFNSEAENGSFNLISSTWKRIYIAVFGTFVAGLVWLPIFINNSYGNELTDWIQGERVGFAWISPIFQALAAWITMISLLPVEAPQLGVVIASGLVMLIFFIWLTPILIRGYKILRSSPQTRLMTQALSSLILGAIILFFILTYFFGIDLTRGARYNFVYFPAVMILVGAILAAIWDIKSKEEGRRKLEVGWNLDGNLDPCLEVKNQEKLRWGVTGKQAVGIILVMGFISSITVVCNLGYQKYYRPDIFVKLIEKTSQTPVLIATTQKTHVQIGEMMGIAREFKIHKSNGNFNQMSNQTLNQNFNQISNQNSNLIPFLYKDAPNPAYAGRLCYDSPSLPGCGRFEKVSYRIGINPKFLLAHLEVDKKASTITLQNALKTLPRPIDLWLVNFHAPAEVKDCIAENQSLPNVNGYEYKLFHCE